MSHGPPSPSWWNRRERIAARVGPLFWPAWYLAPRSTRDRWADFAAAIDAKGDQLDLAEALTVLDRHGLQLVRRGGDAPLHP